jgi:hypothetical protein
MLDSQPFLECDTGPAGPRLEQLQQQERVWFAWVCRLHDVHSSGESAHSAAVLAIAKRRWAESRRALERETLQPQTRQGFAERMAKRSRPTP